VDLRFLRAKESIRLSFLIDPRLGGHAVLRREGGSASRFSFPPLPTTFRHNPVLDTTRRSQTIICFSH
jgi:hypothetical protein